LFALTPIERLDQFWVKRDDAFKICGVSGGKARACASLARSASRGLTTASARRSPQSVIVAAIAGHLGLSSCVHTAAGAMTPELRKASLLGANLVFHKPGYNAVIIRRARDDANLTGWTLVPFGMECPDAIRLTARQTINLPAKTKRLVVTVGSGITLAGVLVGLTASRRRLPVLGVVVGADPTRRLDRWAPAGWRDMVALERSVLSYHEMPSETDLVGTPLDPIYEAKCLPFLRPGDCLWVVGHRHAR
jgi:1-aminocyclopropane-1-carboxylate deaminase/D-cysteine desulfhydrase-like pyridoxal-dependent ACC family enzyme